jgi:hypothetical protein
MLRSLCGALLVMAINAGPVLAACDGDEIFSDDFSDPQLSKDQWEPSGTVSIGSGYLQIKPQQNSRTGRPIPNSAGTKEFDLCFDIIYPVAKNNDGDTVGGVILFFKDWKNNYLVVTSPVGVVGAMRILDDKGRLMGKKLPADTGLKPGAGARNSFQVTVKSNVVTVYANGRRLFAFKTVAKDADAAEMSVGLYAESEKDQENAWQFSNVKLTEPPK